MTDRNDAFLDLGYTSPETAQRIRNERLAKTAGKVVRKTTRKRPYHGRPPVGEEGVLLNVDTEVTPLDADQSAHQVATVWSDMEANAIAGLEADLTNAIEKDDSYRGALARTAIDRRQARWDGMKRPPLQLMIPGMNNANLKYPDESSDTSHQL